jgi:hypothetical protein
VNGDVCVTSGAVKKNSVRALVVKLEDGATAPVDGRGVRVMLDYSGGALVTAGATTAPVTVTLGGRAQDEVWVRTSSKPDFVNVTATGVVSVGTAATNPKKDIALTKVGGLSLFLGTGADVVKAGDATLPITAYGESDADVIAAGSGNDLLDGGDGDDTLVGGVGDDMLVGGAGDDTLDGQGDCDAYDGGGGVDTNLDDQSAAKVDSVEADFARGRSWCWSARCSVDAERLGDACRSDCVALSLDDPGGYGAIPASTTRPLRRRFSVTAWVRQSVLSLYGQGVNAFVAQGRDNSSTYAWMLSASAPSQRASFALFDGVSNPEVVGTTPLEPGRWFHLAATYDGAVMRLYVNGVLEGSLETSVDPGANAASVVFGRWPNQPDMLRGSLSEVAMFDRPLTAVEVRTAFAGPQPVPPAGVVGAYLFNGRVAGLTSVAGAGPAGVLEGQGRFVNHCVRGGWTVSRTCAQVLSSGRSLGDGWYDLDPDGSGPRPAFATRCEMTTDGGGWTLLVPGYLSSLESTVRQYLLRCEGQCTGAVELSREANDAWYVSPATTTVWRWSSPALVPGLWRYGGRNGSGLYPCFADAWLEAPSWGLGCGTGTGGGGEKLLPWTADGFSFDSTLAETGLCQDRPGVFGHWQQGPNNGCVAHVRVYARDVSEARGSSFDHYGDGIDSDGDGMDCEAARVGTRQVALCGRDGGKVDKSTTWADARATCRAHGYVDLLSVHGAEENEAAFALLRSAGLERETGPWLGLTDAGREGAWVWSDATPAVSVKVVVR